MRSAGSDWWPNTGVDNATEPLRFKSLYYGLSDGGETKVAIFGDMGAYVALLCV